MLRNMRRAWRLLLELDQPANDRSDEDMADEMQRNYRWNFVFSVGEGATFWFGNTFIGGVTIAPLFVSKLTDSAFLIGLVSVISLAGWYLPQLLTARWAEGLARKKAVVVNLGLFSERLPLFVMIGAPLLAPLSAPLALTVFFGSFLWRELGAGVVATSWQDLLARMFPVNRRGRMLGLTFLFGAGSGVLAAWLAGWLLETLPYPTNFAVVFALGAIFVLVSWGLLALVREPIQAVQPSTTSDSAFWQHIGRIWQRDHNFRRFLIARLMLTLGAMGTGFVTVTAFDRFDIPDGVAGTFTGLLLLGQVLGNIMVTAVADRHGHRSMLLISALASAAAFFLAWVAPSVFWFYIVFVLLGFTLGVTIVSGILVVMEFSPAARRPTYVGLASTIVGLGSALAPVIGATLLENLGPAWLFAASGLCSLAALVLLLQVREPRNIIPPDVLEVDATTTEPIRAD